MPKQVKQIWMLTLESKISVHRAHLHKSQQVLQNNYRKWKKQELGVCVQVVFISLFQRQTDRQVDNNQTDRERERKTERQTDRQKDRQKDRQTDRQTDRQRERDRQTDRE